MQINLRPAEAMMQVFRRALHLPPANITMRQDFRRALPLTSVTITIPSTLHTQHYLAGQTGEAWEPPPPQKKKNNALSGMGGALDGIALSLSLNV